MEYLNKKLYLHPVTSSQKLRTKHFQIKTEGVTGDGTRLRHIESGHRAVHHGYRHAIMVEPPGQDAYNVYGEYDEINQLAASLKDCPEKVMKRVRPLPGAQGNEYYLNKPAPPNKTYDLTPAEMEEAAAAERVFPEMGEDNRPFSRMQEEKRTLKKHLREVEESKVLFPSSSTGQAEIEARLNPKQSPPSVLFDGEE